MTTSETFTSIDSLISACYPADEPGAAVIIARGGQMVFRKGYGLANLEWNIPIQPDTVFKVGSVTKQFTAVSVLMLVQEGKLGLQDRIEKFLPDYPTHGHSITLEHLLTHTSGIKSYTSLPEWNANWGKDYTVAEMIETFKFKPMDFAPGTRWSYNNSAFFLLGAIIEKASGLSYNDFLQQRIFNPLDMRQSYTNPGLRLLPKRAAGYTHGPDGYQNAPYLSMTQPGGAGVIASTVDDLVRWNCALDTGELVSAELLQRAWTPYTLADGAAMRYGYGWGIEKLGDRQWIGHGGGIHGFQCYVTRIPSENLFVALLSNSDSGKRATIDLVYECVMASLGEPLPPFQPIDLPAGAAEKLSGVYENQNGEEFHLIAREGALVLRFPAYNFEMKMVALDSCTFCTSDNHSMRLRFQTGEQGQVTGFEMTNMFGTVDEQARKTDRLV